LSENVKTTLRYYGISPWEIEVLYGYLNSHFTIVQDEIEANEMKRRRGSGNALKIVINFSGNPKIVFTVDIEDKQWFDNALEKIDFVLELLPFHMDPQKLPSEVSKIAYKFDPESIRWRRNSAASKNKKFRFIGDSWDEII
jgi:hypothetical protein